MANLSVRVAASEAGTRSFKDLYMTERPLKGVSASLWAEVLMGSVCFHLASESVRIQDAACRTWWAGLAALYSNVVKPSSQPHSDP